MNTNEVFISLKEIRLGATLNQPENAKALVIFSHGSGSSRFSTRNSFVAGILNQNGFATLLTDLLTGEEDLHYANRFDIPLLSERLVKVTEWTQELKELNHLPVGYFGASTGAASALLSSVYLNSVIRAVVSRGGRPDLAMDQLPNVKAPTLLIVGSLDDHVIELNQKAYHKMNCEKQMMIVEGASHLFEEPGKMKIVATAALDWFEKKLFAETLETRLH